MNGMNKKTCVIKPKIKNTIEGCYESEHAVTNIPERLEDFAERLDDAKEKLRVFKQYLPDKMNGYVYDQ